MTDSNANGSRRPANQITARSLGRDPVNWLAFGFGAGLAPKAPGTVGTLLALPVAWLTLDLGTSVQTAVALLLIVSGIWICGASARRIGVHDHGGIVWDEIAGMYLTLLFAPPTIFGWSLAFLAFRFFDIVSCIRGPG